MFLSFWPKNIIQSNKDSFDFRSLYFKVSAVAKVCRRIMWGAGREDCTNFTRFFIRTMRCFIFSVKTILVKNRSGLGFGGGQWQLYISQQKTNILFCGQYISSQMTSEGSLLIFLFFFLIRNFFKGYVHEECRTWNWALFFSTWIDIVLCTNYVCM